MYRTPSTRSLAALALSAIVSSRSLAGGLPPGAVYDAGALTRQSFSCQASLLMPSCVAYTVPAGQLLVLESINVVVIPTNTNTWT